MFLIAKKGPVLGRFQGGPIYAWLEDVKGVRFFHERTVPDYPNCSSLVLRADELLLDPGVVYRQKNVVLPGISD